MAIQSFADEATEEFFNTGRTYKGIEWAYLGKVAYRKLDMLNYAGKLSDLACPPGNRLEALKGNLIGFHSIRINAQWRILFRWSEHGPSSVKICDYHT